MYTDVCNVSLTVNTFLISIQSCINTPIIFKCSDQLIEYKFLLTLPRYVFVHAQLTLVHTSVLAFKNDKIRITVQETLTKIKNFRKTSPTHYGTCKTLSTAVRSQNTLYPSIKDTFMHGASTGSDRIGRKLLPEEDQHFFLFGKQCTYWHRIRKYYTLIIIE